MSENLEGKVVYLVRHGETLSNVNLTVQGLEGGLTPLGEIQAEQLADRATRLEFDALISSDAVRAVQTAALVGKRTKHTLETDPVFREVRVPTALVGKSKSEDEAKIFLRFCDEHEHEDVHFTDEENLFDLHRRACEAITFLERHPAEKIFLVTHGMFLRMMVVAMMFGPVLNPAVWKSITTAMRTKNTGITIWRHGKERWYMYTWNDHAHLG